MSTIAELMVRVGVLDEVEQGMTSARDKISAGADKMVTTGAAMSKKVTLPILAAGGAMFALAGRQEDAEAKLSSSFESMGAAAWTTTDALKEQASAIQDVTTFGDESILEFQSVLLTFGNVTDDVFTDATRLGADMSAKLGTDLQSSAIQLGKALNDPVQGVSALSRVGVSFTEDQKDMIKEMQAGGDMAGAQAIILGELEKQFGGTAEAMAQTGTGQAKQAMNALGDAGESIGAILIPVVSKAARWLKTLAERFQNLSPQAKEWIVRIGAIVAAIGPVLFIGGKLIKGMLGIAKVFGVVGKAFMALSKLMMANPWILLIAAVVALVVIIVKNWDTIVDFLKGVWEWIKNAAGAVGEWISDAFKKAVEFVKNLFLNFTPLGLIIKHFDKIKELATKVKDWIVEKFQQAVDWLKGLGAKVTTAVGDLFKKVRELAVAAKDWVVDRFTDVVDFIKGLPGKIASAASGMWDGIKNAFRSAINWIIDKWNALRFTIPKIDTPFGTLGGGSIGVPKIPRLHDGGIFRAPPGQREGLALLEDGERVTAADDAKAGGTTYNLFTLSRHELFRELRAAGVEIDKLGWR